MPVYAFHFTRYDEAFINHQAQLTDINTAVDMAQSMDFNGYMEIWEVRPDGIYQVAVVARNVSYTLAETGERDHGSVVKCLNGTEYVIYREPVLVSYEFIKWLDESED